MASCSFVCVNCELPLKERISKYYFQLGTLCSISSLQSRTQYIRYTDSCFISFLTDCCIAIHNRLLPTPKQALYQRESTKTSLQLIACKGLNVNEKRKLFIQLHGGVLFLIKASLALVCFGVLNNFVELQDSHGATRATASFIEGFNGKKECETFNAKA